MQKIKALFKPNSNQNDNQFNSLVAQADAHLNLQQFWQAIAPKIISQSSFAGSLNGGLLTVYAYNNSVAAKIKLTSASLLTQLQNLQKTDVFYKQCKVTGIKVKVQVKSQQKRPTTEPRTISRRAATTLRTLADNLGDTSLADKLKKIADNS
ncbi:MAG: DciA family protein [Methylophilaceae bacterium]